MSLALRDYQQHCVDGVVASWRAGHRHTLLVLPTGGGKTVIFTHIAERAVLRGRRVGLVLPRVELVNQTRKALTLPHGVIRAGVSPSPRESLQVASAQTLCRRTDRYEFDLIVVDEAHHATAQTWRTITDAYPRAHVLGVTATPCRTDGTGLGTAGYTDMVLGPSPQWLTDAGYLSPAEVYAQPGAIDGLVRGSGGEYTRASLRAVAEKSAIVGCPVAHYRKYADRQPAIGFCIDIAHAERKAADFRAAGYSARVIDGTKTDREREEMITALGTGNLNVLLSVNVLSEGVDVPVVVCGILMRPTLSVALHLQQMGRCLRPAPGKTNAVILDHVGNTARHGLPTDARDWSLDGLGKPVARRDPDAISVKICESCTMPFESARTCPLCGHEHPLTPREIEEIAGELERLDARVTAKQAERAASSYEDFKKIGEARGYNPGWAKRRWDLRKRRMSA